MPLVVLAPFILLGLGVHRRSLAVAHLQVEVLGLLVTLDDWFLGREARPRRLGLGLHLPELFGPFHIEPVLELLDLLLVRMMAPPGILELIDLALMAPPGSDALIRELVANRFHRDALIIELIALVLVHLDRFAQSSLPGPTSAATLPCCGWTR